MSTNYAVVRLLRIVGEVKHPTPVILPRLSQGEMLTKNASYGVPQVLEHVSSVTTLSNDELVALLAA